MKYNCLIVDDEPLARRIIARYLSDFDQMNIVGQCGDAFEAISILQNERVDLLFLDINMPKLSGINFLKSLKQPPLVIFTTAYAEYAVEGFELEAVDYLLKPIALERFTKAILKAIQQLQLENKTLSQTNFSETIIIKADKKIYKVKQDDILYLEAYGDYVKIFTKNSRLIPKAKLSELFQELNPNYFVQSHRSFIINTQYISYIEGNQAKVGEVLLPISQGYKSQVLEKFRG